MLVISELSSMSSANLASISSTFIMIDTKLIISHGSECNIIWVLIKKCIKLMIKFGDVRYVVSSYAR